MKFANQNFLSVEIFVFWETRKFLFTLQTRQIAYILLQNLLNCTLFSCIWITFGHKPPMGGLQRPPYPLMLELLPKSLRITSEKIIRTLRVYNRYSYELFVKYIIRAFPTFFSFCLERRQQKNLLLFHFVFLFVNHHNVIFQSLEKSTYRNLSPLLNHYVPFGQ